MIKQHNLLSILFVGIFVIFSQGCQHERYIKLVGSGMRLVGSYTYVVLDVKTPNCTEKRRALFRSDEILFIKYYPRLNDYRIFADTLEWLARKGEITLTKEQQSKQKIFFIDETAYSAFCAKYKTPKKVFLTYFNIRGLDRDKDYSIQELEIVIAYMCKHDIIVGLDKWTGNYYVAPEWFKFSHADSLLLLK